MFLKLIFIERFRPVFKVLVLQQECTCEAFCVFEECKIAQTGSYMILQRNPQERMLLLVPPSLF